MRNDPTAELNTTNDIPFIDPRIEYVGSTKLRSLNATSLGKLKKTIVIQDNHTPVAVLLNFEQYLAIQNKVQALQRDLDAARDLEAAHKSAA